jgi:hypothetical protein
MFYGKIDVACLHAVVLVFVLCSFQIENRRDDVSVFMCLVFGKLMRTKGYNWKNEE